MARTSTALALAFGLLVALASTADAGIKYEAKLRKMNSDADPQPGSKVNSRGAATLELQDDGFYHGMVIVFNMVDQLFAHIHEGPAGAIGPVVYAPFPAGSPLLNGSFSYPISVNASILDEMTLENEGYYYNVHTAKFPIGEIRGQFVAC